MTYTLDFTAIYGKVRPIVLKLRTRYFIKMWEADDWHQEGMITLCQLLEKEPELVYDWKRLRIYFKTKFSNRVKDEIRKQESIKRSFDRMVYDEISEVAHSVSAGGLDVSELVAYREAMAELYESLTAEEQEWMTCLMSGECFRGKRAFQRKVRAQLGNLGWGGEYGWNTRE